MSAYLTGDYAVCLVGRSARGEAGSAGDGSLQDLAYAAVASLDRLIEGDDRDEILTRAAKLLEKIQPLE